MSNVMSQSAVPTWAHDCGRYSVITAQKGLVIILKHYTETGQFLLQPVRYHVTGDERGLHCNCKAGLSGRHCKHVDMALFFCTVLRCPTCGCSPRPHRTMRAVGRLDPDDARQDVLCVVCDECSRGGGVIRATDQRDWLGRWLTRQEYQTAKAVLVSTAAYDVARDVEVREA